VLHGRRRPLTLRERASGVCEFDRAGRENILK